MQGWQRETQAHGTTDGGYAMAALLVGLGVMAAVLSVALPTWSTLARREREAELVFRGEQYARAIGLYQRKFANAFPPTVDLLVEQKFLRRKYLDPIAGAEFQPLYVGDTDAQGGRPGAAGGSASQAGRGASDALAAARGGGATAPSGLAAAPLGGRAGIMGVTSKSTESSLREYNGRTKYNEWAFVATLTTTQAGAPTGGQTPADGRGGIGREGAAGRGGTAQPIGGGQRGNGQPLGGARQPFGGARGSGQ